MPSDLEVDHQPMFLMEDLAASSSEIGSSQCSSDEMEELWSPVATTPMSSTEWLEYDAVSGNWRCVLHLDDSIFKDMSSLRVQSEWLRSNAYLEKPCTLRDAKVLENRQSPIAPSMNLVLPGPGNTEIFVQCLPESGLISMRWPSASWGGAPEEMWSKISAIFIYGTLAEWKIYLLYEAVLASPNGDRSRLWCTTVTPELERLDGQLRNQTGIISYCTVLNEYGSTAMKERERLLSMISTAGSVTDYCFICWTDIDLDWKLRERTPTPTGRKSTSPPTINRKRGTKRALRRR